MRLSAPRDPNRSLERLDRVVEVLDSSVRVPSTDQRVGVDGLIGLIPGVGDLISLAFSLYVVTEAARFDLPVTRLAHMGWNVAVDAAIGTIPVIGDLFDFGWKANNQNLELLRKTLRERRPDELGGDLEPVSRRADAEREE